MKIHLYKLFVWYLVVKAACVNTALVVCFYCVICVCI